MDHKQEDVIPSGGHCCEVASKLEEMNSKIDKVLSLFTEMETVKKNEWINWTKLARNWRKQHIPQILKF